MREAVPGRLRPVRFRASAGTNSATWYRLTLAPETAPAPSATACAILKMWPYML